MINGAAKFYGASLNKPLLNGPDLLQNLFMHVTASDNSHMPSLPTSSECFHWLDVYHQINQHFAFSGGRTLQMTLWCINIRSKFLGQNFWDNYALQRIARHNAKFYPEAAKAIHENLYMDIYIRRAWAKVEPL